ncbi:MAG: site-specific integrase [Eubacterium sp.]|nr:site-specific integrase [Eubacterium sp.]
MDDIHLTHELHIIAQAVKSSEQSLYRLDLLEREITEIKYLLHSINITIRNSICTLLGGIAASKLFNDTTTSYYEYEYQSPTLQLSQQFVGYGNQNTITEEIKAMIVELHIKGSVRERANGLIELRTQALGSIYGRSREEIEFKLNQKLKEAKSKKKDSVNKNKAPLMSEFFHTEYLPYKKNQGRSEASLLSYNSLFSYITRAGFDKPITTYKAKEIEDFLYSIPHSRTRQMLQGFLNNVFKRAIALGVLKVNPCSAIEKMQHTQEQGTAFSFEEQREFFDNLTRSDSLTYMEKCYFFFVYLTGTRKKEALSVTAEDVDFKNKVLSIRGTKTEGSNRQIPLTPTVEKMLLSLQTKKGAYFPINEHRVEKLYNKVRNRHKLHDLRHTYGTIQICVEKVDVKTVSLVMGHSTVNTTLAIYTHPEQLDKGIFLRGDLTADEKLAMYRSNYREISCQIEQFIQ